MQISGALTNQERLDINQKEVNQVDTFSILGSIVSCNGRMVQDVNRALNKIWITLQINKKTRIKMLLNSIVKSLLWILKFN